MKLCQRTPRGNIARALTAAVATTLISLSSTSSHASGKAASFVVDANTGSIIFALNADEPRYPASLTKMMTLYMTFDLLKQGRLHDGTRIRISPHAASAQPTKLGLETGDDVALIDAIKSLITLSANDIAIAIAEHIGGSEDHFAALMTEKAHAIGMRNTTFKNASGLPNSHQVTTARDMVTLGLRLQDDFPTYFALFSLREFRYAGHVHPNHNTMLNDYEGTDGIKTGYTSASGFNLVSSVKRGSKHVVGAVFGGVTARSRNQTMRTLLNLALYKASVVKTRVPVSLMAKAQRAPTPRPDTRPVVRQATVGGSSAIAPPAPATPAPAQTTDGRQQSSHVEIARVRPVRVAPRQQPLAAAPAATEEPPLPLRLASAAPENTTPVIQPYREASLRPPMAAGFAPSAIVPTARGNPPSTLQQQAANLSGVSLASAPVAALRTSTNGSVEIQIGAFATAAEAEHQLKTARAKAPDLIGGATAKTQPVTANGKALWRARFAGFQVSNAGTVCTELRRRRIDCLVTRSE